MHDRLKSQYRRWTLARFCRIMHWWQGLWLQSSELDGLFRAKIMTGCFFWRHIDNLIWLDDAQVLCCGPCVESENIVVISQRVIAGRIVSADTKGVPIHTKLESIAKFHLHSSTPNVTSDLFAINLFVPRFRCEFSKYLNLACWCRFKFKLSVDDTSREQKGLAYFKSDKFLDFFHTL